MKFTVFFSVFIILLSFAARAQDEPIRSRTDLVTVNVAVMNEQGKFVEGLEKK